MSQETLFLPTPEQQQQSEIWHFAQQTVHFHKALPGDYPALHAWSIEDPENFHAALWEQLDIIGDRGEQVYIGASDIRKVKFFPEAKLNYAENLLRDADERAAMIAYVDDGTRREISRSELRDAVSRMVQAFQQEGITVGDRVAAIVSNDIEALIAYLACASIGAVFASCSPDFGPLSARDRLCQINPSILIAVGHYQYAGKTIDVSETILAVAQGCRLKRIVMLNEGRAELLATLPCTSWNDWLSPFKPAPIDYVRLAYDAPLVILFSSGTTGQPKCIVHSAMGLLLQHKKELILHCDLKPGERMFYFTTCGWMMWNWLVSALACAATLVTYDGNPFYPSSERLLDIIDAEDIAVFGTSAKYLDACSKHGVAPLRSHRLSALRLILSTGSPLLPATFDYIYADWKQTVDLASISGGSDICGCFLGGNPLLPVIRGELKCALLGMDIDTVDANGQHTEQEPGELVCRNAHVSMPLFFWGDTEGQRYHEAYFARFPNIWTHGDLVERRPSGGFIIHGRSDTTLNPGGVRIGSAEIYRQLDTMSEIEEAVVAAQDVDGDQRVILFVKMQPDCHLDNELEQKIRSCIRRGASPRHVPARIIAVDDIPRTHSGKLSEIAVRETINGRPVTNMQALANPESLSNYANLPELCD